MSAGRHDWVVLDSEEAHAQVVGDFVAEGVRRGERVLLIGLGVDREERLRARLRRQGLPANAGAALALAPDPYVLRAAITDSLAGGCPGVRFTGALTTPGRNAFEAVVSELAATLPLTVLCPYFRDLLLPGQREELTALHDAEHDATAEYDDGVFRLVRDAPTPAYQPPSEGCCCFALRQARDVPRRVASMPRSVLDPHLVRE